MNRLKGWSLAFKVFIFTFMYLGLLFCGLMYIIGSSWKEDLFKKFKLW